MDNQIYNSKCYCSTLLFSYGRHHCSTALIATLQVSTFGDAKNKKQSNRKPRPAADDGPSGIRQPQASATAAAASTRWTSTAPARSLTETSQPSPRTPDGPAVAAGRTWRAPSRRHSFRHRFDSTGRPGGLWTAATTLGVIVLFGRVTAVVFLCSCLYGARFVRARAAGAGAKAKSSGVAGGSRRFGDPAVGVAAEKAVAVGPRAAEECKKKVVVAGLLDRAGKTPSSRFGR